MWIDEIQLSFQMTAGQILQIAFKVSVDVIRMAFVLNKRAVHVNLRNPNFPQLATKNPEVFHKVGLQMGDAPKENTFEAPGLAGHDIKQFTDAPG